jgi:hypothetical protein
MKDLLKAVSPAAALLGDGEDAGFALGIIPGLMRRKHVEDKAEEARQAAIAASAQGKPMKKGGKVSASSRADGCAQRGKTKGRMV